MTDTGADGALAPVRNGINRLIFGREDPRLRATWRVLVAGLVVVPLSQPISLLVAGVVGVRHPMVVGLAQAAFVALVLLGWARYVDRRRPAAYGLAATPEWLLDLLAGFVAVWLGFAIWLGLGTATGWATVEVAPGPPAVLGLGALLIAVVVNVWVQEVVYVGLVLTNAAEGLFSRGVEARQAVLAAWAVSVFFFTFIHGVSTVTHMVNFFVVLGVYAGLYVQSGSLALPVGVHTGVNFTGGVLIGGGLAGADGVGVLQVSTSLGGVLGGLHGGAVPHVLVAYGLLVGWLLWRHGEVEVREELVGWAGRD